MIRPILRLRRPGACTNGRHRSILADPDLPALIADLVETMPRGLGRRDWRRRRSASLNASSSSISRRRSVPSELLVLINPEFVARDGLQLEEEGCLSVPGFQATVARPQSAVVRGLDAEGRPRTAERHWSAGPRAPARDGPPRRHPLHRPAAATQPAADLSIASRPDAEKAHGRLRSGFCVRIVFFGTPDFAVPSLEALLASRHQVVGVVTQPDRPRGRGQHVSGSPVKARAEAAAIPILQPTKLNDLALLDALRSLGPELGVVAAYGRILPQALLDLPRLGMINVHASLLPRHRGASPMTRAILDGDTRTGITIMRVVQALDAGPMLATRETAIEPDETGERARGATRDARCRAARRVLDAARARRRRRDAAGRGPRHLRAADRQARRADRVGSARRRHPRPGAGARAVAPRVHVPRWRAPRAARDAAARVVDRRASDRSQPARRWARGRGPGVVLAGRGKGVLLVGAADGTVLEIRRLQEDGRRVLTAREFLAGHPLVPGTRFTTGPS